MLFACVAEEQGYSAYTDTRLHQSFEEAGRTTGEKERGAGRISSHSHDSYWLN